MKIPIYVQLDAKTHVLASSLAESIQKKLGLLGKVRKKYKYKKKLKK
jgi:hypothetical protein